MIITRNLPSFILNLYDRNTSSLPLNKIPPHKRNTQIATIVINNNILLRKITLQNYSYYAKTKIISSILQNYITLHHERVLIVSIKLNRKIVFPNHPSNGKINTNAKPYPLRPPLLLSPPYPRNPILNIAPCCPINQNAPVNYPQHQNNKYQPIPSTTDSLTQSYTHHLNINESFRQVLLCLLNYHNTLTLIHTIAGIASCSELYIILFSRYISYVINALSILYELSISYYHNAIIMIMSYPPKELHYVPHTNHMTNIFYLQSVYSFNSSKTYININLYIDYTSLVGLATYQSLDIELLKKRKLNSLSPSPP